MKLNAYGLEKFIACPKCTRIIDIGTQLKDHVCPHPPKNTVFKKAWYMKNVRYHKDEKIGDFITYDLRPVYNWLKSIKKFLKGDANV